MNNSLTSLIKSTLGLMVLLALAGCGGGSGGSSEGPVAAIQCAVPEPLSFAPAAVSGAQIGGIIEIEANARIDKDTAEFIEEFGRPLQTAVEQLASSFILGGYLSAVSGIYNPEAEREFRYPVDAGDRYCVDLEPGQRISLELFGAEGATRLRLLRLADAAVIADTAAADSSDSADNGLSKWVRLPGDQAAGIYAVDLQARQEAGPYRYVLSSSATGSAVNLAWSRGDFIAGEAVVTLRETDSLMAQASMAQASTSAAMMNLERALGGNQHKATMPATILAQGQSLADQKRQTVEWVRALRERSDVLSASPNYIFTALATAFDSVNEPLYPDQWHYPLINLPQAWQLVPDGGSGVKVAVLDTGIFRDGQAWHEDLQPNIGNCSPTTCVDFVAGGTSLPIDPGSTVGGSVYHGTHVAGTVAASGGNALGGAGVAPSAQILPVRVLDENGSGSLSDIVSAINWSVTNGANVINLSLGSPSNPDTLKTAVDNAVAANVLIVAAAGNSPTTQPVYPAAFDNVFGVGAVDGAGIRAGYSNIGNSVNLMGPGGDASRDANQDGRADVVISASGNASGSTYAGLQGTSMAAPHVAGVFALMKQLDPNMSTAVLKALLADNFSITISPPAGEPGYGVGLIDAAKAVQAVGDGTLTVLSPLPSIVEFVAPSSEEVLVLEKVGNPSGDITIDTVTIKDNSPWLSVGTVGDNAGDSVGDSVAGRFSLAVRIDRSQLESGRAYRSELTIEYVSDKPRSLTVPVVVAVASPTETREAGLHFVLLLDETTDSVAQAALTSSGGVYRFAFEVVPDDESKVRSNQVVAGRSYYLVAGTDLDNDSFICAPGEACAEYPIAGLREKLAIVLNADGTAQVEEVDAETGAGNGNVISAEDLVMTTSFSRPLSAQSLPRPGFEGYKLLEPVQNLKVRSIAD